MQNVFFKLLITISLVLAHAIARAEDNFLLTHIAAPSKVDKTDYPLLDTGSLGADEDGAEIEHMNALTIRGNKLVYNDVACNYEIESVDSFHIDRALVHIIDGAGGDKRFNRFLKTKLHTDMKQWKTRYWLKASKVDIENKACQLLQNQFIFRSKNELILTDTTYFYRFVLDKKFKW